MEEFVQETLKPHFNFWVYVILMMMGLWAVIAKNNLLKKLIGLAIFQTSIILLFVSLGVKEGATIPILDHHGLEYVHDHEADDGTEKRGKAPLAIDPDGISNPLPHVLMLTAIVVGVATIGVALALVQMIFKEFDTIEEDELLIKIKALHDDA